LYKEVRIQYLRKQFSSAGQKLAFEEALLDYAEEHDHPGFVHFWDSSEYFVVLGYSKQLEQEVRINACRDLGIPILRRSSGGGTILQGPGCFNYSLVLPIESDPALATISGTNRAIMERQRDTFEKLLGQQVKIQGHTDLTTGNLKFSGNAQRRKKRCLLFHGAILLSLDLRIVERTLQMPRQQPEYRESREHAEFLTNIERSREVVEHAIVNAWNAQQAAVPADLQQRTEKLVAEKYSREDWNAKW
jgi:lipoate---protein ligase